jgi:hypothetical protein
MAHRTSAAVLLVVSCGSSTAILRDPSTTNATTKSLAVGESVCWVEPKWMYPGPTDCHGYWEPAPGVPKCTTAKPRADLTPTRTVWGTGYDYDPELTKKTRASEPLACCYRCVDKLHDLGE